MFQILTCKLTLFGNLKRQDSDFANVESDGDQIVNIKIINLSSESFQFSYFLERFYILRELFQSDFKIDLFETVE